MLSLSVVALAQIPDNENGTGHAAISSDCGELTSDAEAATDKTRTADSATGDDGWKPLYYIEIIGKLLAIFGGLITIVVGAIKIHEFLKHKESEEKQPHKYDTQVETSKNSAVSKGDHSLAIKADNTKGDVYITTYSGSTKPPSSGGPPSKKTKIPHPRNPNFTGRVDLLDHLYNALTSGVPQAITGLGGVGKTQLALEYAYRHEKDYDVLWWVRSEEAASLASDYANLAIKLDLTEKNPTEQGVIIEAVRTWLEQNDKWMVIFDNAQDPKDVRDYLPRTNSGHVIITSRNPNWGNIARTISVDVFNRGESIEFLCNRTGQDDENAADALAKALGDLPLALEQAGAYIEETDITLRGYLNLFLEHQNDILKRGKPIDYHATIDTTWEISFLQAKKESKVSADLLNLCAFLAPDNIPEQILIEGAQVLPESLAVAITDKMSFNDAVAALRRYSLINREDESFSVHGLVQAVTRDGLEENDMKKWSEAALNLMNRTFPFESKNARVWPQCKRLLPHVLAATDHAEALGVATSVGTPSLNQAGLYLMERAQFHEATELFERGLAISEAAYGPDDPNVSTVVNNLGIALQYVGDLEGARKHYERALKIDEENYGNDHPNVSTVVNNIGMVLLGMGNLEGAEEHLERALKIDEENYGNDHPNVARDLNNLGMVLLDMGDLEGAKEHLEEALKISETIYEDHNHPELASVINNLGVVLKDMGDLEGARKHYERALKIDEENYGNDHLNVTTVVNNLGAVLQDMGDLEGARKYYERVLKIEEENYGNDHPNVSEVVNNLGVVLQGMGDLKGAKEHYERALEIDEKAYGSDHPSTVIIRNNLDFIKREMED